MGRSTTDQEKHLTGTYKPSRERGADVVEFPVIQSEVECPQWLNPDGQEEWNRIVPLLLMAKHMTEADYASLAHYCDLHGWVVDQRKRGNDVPASQYTQLRAYAVEFGLTPKSRMAPTQESKKGNKFAGRGKRS